MDKKAGKKVNGDSKRSYVAQEDVPGYSLEDALRVPEAIIDNYGGKPTTPLNVAAALKLAPQSSHFRGLCGASIAYGLTQGGYNAKTISLESLAKRILTPLKEGEDDIAKREAALKPRIIGDFVRKYENSPFPRPDIAANVLVEFGVPKDRADKVFNLITETAERVGLVREVKGKKYFDLSGVEAKISSFPDHELEQEVEQGEASSVNASASSGPQKPLGQGIFIGHGKNKKPLEQLKKILEQFKIPYKVSVDEPNLGRPISTKVKEIMEQCNCAVLIFTCDEEFFDKNSNSVWRPSENVIHELGASSYLYGTKIVILKEEGVELPSNFRDLGYIAFEKDQLQAKTMDMIKELIGFGILKIST